MFIMAATSLGWALEVQAPLAAVLVVGFFMGLGTGTNNTGKSLIDVPVAFAFEFWMLVLGIGISTMGLLDVDARY